MAESISILETSRASFFFSGVDFVVRPPLVESLVESLVEMLIGFFALGFRRTILDANFTKGAGVLDVDVGVEDDDEARTVDGPNVLCLDVILFPLKKE